MALHARLGASAAHRHRPRALRRGYAPLETDQRVAEIHERALSSMQLSFRESCQSLAEEFSLTKRETELMILICDGMSRNEVADSLGLSTNTVKYHLQNVYRKLHVHNSRDLVAFVEEWRVIPK